MEKTKITGIILNIKPHKEFDRLITLFSAERGIVTIMAKGIRRAKSRRSFHIDLLNAATMELEENAGKNRIPYLREVTTVNSFPHCKKNPEAFASACTVASFLLRTLPTGSSQPDIYFLTEKMLSSLNASSAPASLLLPYFLKIIRLLGYLPQRLPKNALKEILNRTLRNLDPEFMLQARRTLDIFSPSRNHVKMRFRA